MKKMIQMDLQMHQMLMISLDNKNQTSLEVIKNKKQK
jgi:hypothetical protein